jgi:hypothetical protein
MAWLAATRNQARRQRLAAEAIVNHGGMIAYDYQLPSPGSSKSDPNAEPAGPAGLRTIIGEDIFAHVVRARIVNDSDVDLLKELSDVDWLELAMPLNDGSHLDRLVGLKRLKRLGFDFTPVTDSQFDYIKGLTGLRMLFVQNARITDNGLKTIEGLHDLERLRLSGPNFTDAALIHVARLTHLTRLDLNGRGFTDDGLPQLRALTHLRELHLDCTSISDVGMDDLTGLPELEILDLGGTHVTDPGLLVLAEIRTLRQIAVGAAVSAEGISRFRRRLPSCSVVTGLPTDKLGVPVQRSDVR